MGEFENKISEAFNSIKTIINQPKIGIILSPGFEEVAYGIEDADIINCFDIPNFPQDTLQQEIDNFIIGNLQGKKIIAISSASCNCIIKSKEKSDFLMAIFQRIGIKHLIVISSAVSIDKKNKTGDVAIVKDRVNILDHKANSDLLKCDNNVLEIVSAISNMLDIDTKQVVYGCPFDESSENTMEIGKLKNLGVEALGMPTILEFISNTYDINIFHMLYITSVETEALDYMTICSQKFDIPLELKEKYTTLLNEIIAVL